MKIKSEEFITKLFQFQLQLKLYHWNTKYYSNHKATDKLMGHLLNFIDSFTESYIGKFQKINSPTSIILQKNINENSIISKVFQPFLKFLKEWKDDLEPENKEFIHLIEELETEIEKTKYLMRLK